MNYFQKYLVEEFSEDYSEGLIPRRKALRLIAGVVGSTAAAAAILAACAPPPAAQPTLAATSTSAPTATMLPPTATMLPPTKAPTLAPTVAPTATNTAVPATPTPAPTPVVPAGVRIPANDPAINASEIQFPGDPGTLMGYLAYPKAAGQYSVVLVCHENRGLTDHIQDVVRRVAKAGYVGLGVDLLSRQGGTAKLAADAVPGALGNISSDQYVKDFVSGMNYFKDKTYAKPTRVGMVGFCYGGGVTWIVATRVPELLAAVPFYGPPPAEADLPKIKAAVLAVYADRDTRITGTAAAIEAAMKKNTQVYEKMVYPNTDHAFHNDTGARYAADAAQDAWKRTIAWFDKYIK